MPPAPTRPPRPGWYADPRGGEDFRWWDGEGWTAWLADSAYAPRPRGEVARQVPVPILAEPRPMGGVLIGIAAAAVVLLLAAVSVIGQGLPQESQPFMAVRPSSPGTPTKVYEPLGVRSEERVIVIYERLELPVPARSYVALEPTSLPGTLSRARVAYASTDATLSVPVVIGVVDPALIVPGDVAASARKIQPAFIAHYEVDVATTVEDMRVEPWSGPVPGAVRMTFFLRFATPVDRDPGVDVTMLVLPWEQADQSGLALWAALIPRSASEEGRRAVLELPDRIRVLG